MLTRRGERLTPDNAGREYPRPTARIHGQIRARAAPRSCAPTVVHRRSWPDSMPPRACARRRPIYRQRLGLSRQGCPHARGQPCEIRLIPQRDQTAALGTVVAVSGVQQPRVAHHQIAGTHRHAYLLLTIPSSGTTTTQFPSDPRNWCGKTRRARALCSPPRRGSPQNASLDCGRLPCADSRS